MGEQTLRFWWRCYKHAANFARCFFTLSTIFYSPIQVVMDSWSFDQDWKLEIVGELSTAMIMPQCAVMQKKIYLCFWTDSSSPHDRSYQKCVSAKGPLKVFSDIGTSSLYPHHASSQQLASNDRKCILIISKKSLYVVNMLAVGHEGPPCCPHARAELLTPDGKWSPVEDYPYGVYYEYNW